MVNEDMVEKNTVVRIEMGADSMEKNMGIP